MCACPSIECRRQESQNMEEKILKEIEVLINEILTVHQDNIQYLYFLAFKINK